MEPSSPAAGGNDLFGERLYSLEVLLTYFALLGFPFGLFLYGLNVARRGQPWVGYLLSGLAAVTFTLLPLTHAGERLGGWGRRVPSDRIRFELDAQSRAH